MRSKNLITVALASTFGWSAAAFAETSHEVITPFSPNESGEVIFSYKEGFDSRDHDRTVGASSTEAGGTLSGGGYSESLSTSSFSGAGNESASLGMEESLAAADEGIYSDFYTVAWTPVTVDTWDYYIIDTGGTPELVAVSDYEVWMPTHELVLIPSASDEMIYELAVVPTFVDMSGAEEATGE